MRQSPPRQSRRAFTLIELLVVIAIIAILAAILFPVFAQAKAQAKKATAISNVKQIDLASLMYSNDVDDVFTPYFSGLYIPQPYVYVYTSPQIYWPQLLSPYISKVIGSGIGGSNGTIQQADAQDLSKIFFDPIETFKSQAGDPNCTVGNVASWGISDDIVNWWEPNGVATTYTVVSQGAVVAPANTLVFTETFDYLCDPGYPGSSLALSYFDDNNSYKQPYNGGNNAAKQTLQSPYNASYVKTAFNQEPDPAGINNTAMADGHVKSLHTSLLTHDGAYWSIGNNDQWP
ncbi:MAG: prepilin-type N-terminal cleavage/methylation domain-containing protein [Fimbriimonadaceae bacterium]